MSKQKVISITQIILVLIFLISELFLLNENWQLKKKVRSYKKIKPLLAQTETKYDQIKLEREIEGRQFPLYFDSSTSVLNEKVQKNKKPFKIYFLFSLSGCISCIENEVAIWNKFLKTSLHKKVEVIGVIDTLQSAIESPVMRYLHIEFPLYHLSKLQEKMFKYNLSTIPVIFFVSRNNNIILSVFSPSINKKSSNGFLLKVKTIVKCVQ